MRIVAFIVSVLLGTALMMGGIVLIIAAEPHLGIGWLLASTFAMVVLVYGPVMIGSYRAYWDVAASAESRRSYRRLVVIVLGLEVLAAIVTIVLSVAVATGPLLPVVFIGAGAVLTAAALVVGPALYRYDAAHRPAPGAWVAIDPGVVRRRAMSVTATALGIFVIVSAGLLVVRGAFPHAFSLGLVVLFGLEAGMLGGCFVAIFAVRRWNAALRDITDRDPSRLRRVSRAVIRRRPTPLGEGDEVAAARYASIASTSLVFQMVYLVMLYIGLAMNLFVESMNGDLGLFPAIVAAAMVVLLCWLVPAYVGYVRRARRYAREHADLLVAAAPGFGQGVSA